MTLSAEQTTFDTTQTIEVPHDLWTSVIATLSDLGGRAALGGTITPVVEVRVGQQVGSLRSIDDSAAAVTVATDVWKHAITETGTMLGCAIRAGNMTPVVEVRVGQLLERARALN